jgi:urea transport system ATP-binding protein
MLDVQELSVYYGESRILSDVTLSVPEGNVVCLMGRNGVGKTTLMKSIMGVLKTRKGSIMFEGGEMTRRPSHFRARSGIGYVPQGRGIFPYLTVYENLLMGFEATKGKIDLSAVDEMYAMFPVIKQMRNRVAGTLSGGQQQQLALARALVSHPRLLVLDEPTEGIQPSIMHEIEGILISLREKGGISILLVEQFMDFAMNVADHIYVMETGRIVMQKPIGEFDPEAAKEYLAV